MHMISVDDLHMDKVVQGCAEAAAWGSAIRFDDFRANSVRRWQFVHF